MRSSALFLGAAVIVAATALGAAPASAQFYEQHNLVSSDGDADLINSWGLVSGPTTPWWVADNGTNQSTLYDKDGVKQQLKVQVPGKPTGVVFNLSAAGFQLTAQNNTLGKTGKSAFIFATESGTILGWNGTGGANANIAAGVIATPNAIYKGLAIAALDATHARLYATDFHQGRVDVFDETFTVSGDYELWSRICRRMDLGVVQQRLIRLRTHDGQLSRAATSGLEFIRQNRRIRSALADALPPKTRFSGRMYVMLRQNVLDLHYGIRCLASGRGGAAWEVFSALGISESLIALLAWICSCNNRLWKPRPRFFSAPSSLKGSA